MKKKIEQLLSGKFENGQPELLFSQDSLDITMKAGETFQDKLYLGTDENRRIRGYVTSSDRRLVPGMDRFSGTTVCLPYGVDANGLLPGEAFSGWLCFSTNIGEYRISFQVHTEKDEIRSSFGELTTIEEFTDIARSDFREAYRLFTDRGFSAILKNAQPFQKSLYEGLSLQPVTYQHVEEFLVGMGQKQKVEVALDGTEADFFDVKENRQESFVIRRSGWGHLRLEIETKGDFLEASRRVVTDEDFIGSSYQAEYIIHRDRLGKGTQYGQVIVRSPYQELVLFVRASLTSGKGINRNIGEKQHRLSMTRDYLEYRIGNMKQDQWIAGARYEISQLWEKGFDFPEYQMYEAYLLHLEGNDEGAAVILKKYQDTAFTRDNLELAGTYLYLCMLTGLYHDRMQVLRKIQNFYMQKSDSYVLFWILQQIDPEISASPSRAVFLMEELFERGCKSPLLYLDGWNAIVKDMSLLHRLSRYWVQVFLFAGRRGLLTEELSMRFAYLSGYEKTFHESLYSALSFVCERYPSEDSLEAICRYIMKGNPRKPEYFRWFSLAVEQGLRLTRLFEYYVETMDTSYHRELPKPLLMYFTYNTNTLGDTKKAFLFASIIANKERDPQTYESYRETMEDFAVRKLAEGRMNEDYAAIYQEFLSEPEDEKAAREIAARLFTCRLFCDDKKVRSVIVRYSQMEREEVYPCVQGVAYPRIFTEDAAVLFQDDKQRRYAVTVDYNLKKLMEERRMVSSILKFPVSEPSLLLHYCESVPLDGTNLEIFQRLVKSEAFTEAYKGDVRKKILDYYAQHVHGEDLDDYLKQMDYREYALVDRVTLLKILISRGLFVQAMGIIEELGCEGLTMPDLLKLASRLIIRADFEEDEELLALASRVYRSGIYDEVILKYLMQYRFGPTEELLSLRKSAEGFELDTYDLEERILSLLMFTGDYRGEGEEILASYMKQKGKERIIGAFLTHIAYGAFVKEYPMSSLAREGLEYAWKNRWPVNRICRFALLKALSKEKFTDEEHMNMQREILEECRGYGMAFAFFRRLDPQLLSPYQLDDKVFVEHHASPEARVTLYYALDTGLSLDLEYKSEPLHDLYEGIFVKTFTLFYGESLHYYFQVEERGKTHKTTERVLTMNRIEGNPMSKYQLINQMLSARRLDKEQEVLAKIKQYLRQEQYVKAMFEIEKEA